MVGVGSESLYETRGAMIFQDIEFQEKLPKPHKVLLSYESSDELLYVPIGWSFKNFLDEVSFLFPQLGKKFSLIDADFKELNEHGFNMLKKSNSAETWFLLKKNNEDDTAPQDPDMQNMLEKPRYELLKYDVHPNALTQSGNYHFSACYQAFCEFIDNAIQATSKNPEELGRNIKIHIFLKQGLTCIFDNGEGMSSEGLKAFASYFLSQKDRGLEPGSSTTFGYVDGFISKFGVGATQAGFYLGETIKVVSKMKGSPFVTEIAISKEKLHERARNNAPVFEDFKCIRNPGDTSTLDEIEKICLTKLVEQEVEYEHYTCIIIKHVQEKHLQYMHADNCAGLARSLAHVYHYYMHGIRGRLKKLEFDRIGLKNFKEDNKPNVSIHLIVDKGNGVIKDYDLTEVKDDLESQYQIRLKSVFSFCLELKIPEVEEAQVVQGCLMYFPNESGDESLPTTKTFEGEDGKPDPMFECFWQGRLAPLSYVNRLDFCSKPESRTRKQKDLLPDICYQRVRGLLFFNRFTPISNNKLKILLDTRRDLSDAMSDAAASRGLPKYFQQWLEQCHREYDREINYEFPLPNAQQPNNGDVFYGQLRVVHSMGEDCYTSGDTVKIDTRPVAYGKAMYFIKKGKANELGEIVYCRLPEEIYGDIMETRPVMRLAGKPDKAVLARVFAADMLLLPQSIKIHEGSDSVNEVAEKLTFYAGENMKEKTNYWVTVYNGEKPPKAIVELHQKKIGVKVEVSDITLNTLVQKSNGVRNSTGRNPLINQIAIDRRFGFKPFYLDREGVYEVKFSVLLANARCNVDKKLEMKILPNVAEIVNLLDNTPDLVPLGEPVINFKLSFHDVYENNTCMFKDGDSVRITCTCDNMVVKGLQETYKPTEDGKLDVKGLSVEPCGTQLSLTRDYEFWVIAEGIGDVMFPFRLLTGPPEKVQTTQLESYTFENYDNFPEFEVRMLDKYGQPSMVRDKSLRLALSCEAFSQIILLSTIANGKAKFPTTPIRIENLADVTVRNVFVSLVEPDNQKKKNIIKTTLKELFCMQIQVKPSNICQQIKIVQIGDENICCEDFLGLDAVAGSVVSNLKVVAFSENGQQLSDEQFLAQEPHFTCTWAEVNPATLPLLPDCPVTNIVQVNVHNVQCFCKYNGFEIRNEAKLRISVVSGEAVKWSFQLLKQSVNCDLVDGLRCAMKVVVLDKHHNKAIPSKELKPYVTAEHTISERNVSYSGMLELFENEYVFTSPSIINGCEGRVSLFVQDEGNLLAKDSVTLQLLPGLPYTVFCNSTAFEMRTNDPEPWLYMFLNQPISAHVMCSIVDKYGNQVVDLNKVSMTLEWVPKSAGNAVTKKGTAKGEVIFPASVIKCISCAEDDVKMKISCPDMKKLLPFCMNVQVLQCNRVTKIRLEVSDEELMATGGYPKIMVWHETEDGVFVPEVLTRLKLLFYKPSGKSVIMKSIYPPIKRKVVDGVAIYETCPDFTMEEAGLWNLQCQYTETRPQIKQILKEATISSNTVHLKIFPGVAKKFKINLPDDAILNASNTADAAARVLIPPQSKVAGFPSKVELLAVDECGNVADLNTTVFVNIESADEEPREDLVLPQLDRVCQQFKMQGGKLILPRISLKEKIGNDLGYYYLVFTDRKYEPCKVKFSFSTDIEVEKINQAMLPLKAELEKFQKRLKDKQDAVRTKKLELCSHTIQLKKFVSSEPKIREIDDQLAKLRNESDKVELMQSRLRPCQKEQNYPPNNVRQYIKGLVCELAYVSDINTCRILSWFAQGKMRVALCETKEQQKKVFDLGCSAYSLSLILPYNKNGFNPDRDDLLPIDIPEPPKNFKSPMNFAVNLLEFKEENRLLRSTLFWSIFQRTIVVKDIEHAQRYREYLVNMKVSCPAILTTRGDLLAADGLLDPGRRCPETLDKLRYTFSELPPTERPEYHTLKVDIARLEELRRVTFDLNVMSKEVQQCQLDLTNKQKDIMPVIRQHEQKLNNVKRKAEKLQSQNQMTKKRKT